MKNCNFQQCSNLILNNLIDEKYIHISENPIKKTNSSSILKQLCFQIEKPINNDFCYLYCICCGSFS